MVLTASAMATVLYFCLWKRLLAYKVVSFPGVHFQPSVFCASAPPSLSSLLFRGLLTLASLPLVVCPIPLAQHFFPPCDHSASLTACAHSHILIHTHTNIQVRNFLWQRTRDFCLDWVTSLIYYFPYLTIFMQFHFALQLSRIVLCIYTTYSLSTCWWSISIFFLNEHMKCFKISIYWLKDF